MTNEVFTEKDYFSIIWSVHNFSYCWQKTGDVFASTSFCVNERTNTVWKLLLFPRGKNNGERITLCLSTEKDFVTLTNVNYNIQILASDGSVLDMPKCTTGECTILRFQISDKTKYLPHDIFTIRCRIHSLGEASETQQLFARTYINIETISLQASVEKFSSWEAYQARSFLLKSASKDIIMSIEPFVTSNNKTCILVNFSSLKRCTCFFLLKAFILDCRKIKRDFGEWESWLDNGKFSKFICKYSKDYIMRNKSLFLPNDVLTLSFEFTISTGYTSDLIEKASCEYTSLQTSNIVTANCGECISHGNVSACLCPLINDLTSLQKDHSTCDMKLKTKTNVFPVHTLILSARSPVFKAMFSSEMKETVNGRVDVSDLDDETVHRLLSYLYTNQLEDLEWEDACLLYAAADKYAVTSLKVKCSAFLKNSLFLVNVCKILSLAYLHQDEDLKVTAQDFILKNASVILKSEEWKVFVDTYSKLAIETLSRRWIKD